MPEPSPDRIFCRASLELVFARDTVFRLNWQLLPFLEARLPLSILPTCASGVTDGHYSRVLTDLSLPLSLSRSLFLLSLSLPPLSLPISLSSGLSSDGGKINVTAGAWQD